MILAKSGQHTIPYEVLEQARNEAKQLREQLAQSQQAQNRAGQAAGADGEARDQPDVDPDDISQEELEQLAQDYPDLGKSIAAGLPESSKAGARSPFRSRFNHPQPGTGRTAGGT